MSTVLVFPGDTITIRTHDSRGLREREYRIARYVDGIPQLEPVLQPGLYVTSNNVEQDGTVSDGAIICHLDEQGNLTAKGHSEELVHQWRRQLGLTRVVVVRAEEWEK